MVSICTRPAVYDEHTHLRSYAHAKDNAYFTWLMAGYIVNSECGLDVWVGGLDVCVWVGWMWVGGCAAAWHFARHAVEEFIGM